MRILSFPVISAYHRFGWIQVLLYDHILTFDQEMQLIWHGKMTASKLLFLFNRYLAPIVMLIRTHGNWFLMLRARNYLFTLLDFNDISVPVFSVTVSVGSNYVPKIIIESLSVVSSRLWHGV